MKITGSYTLHAPAERVWPLLREPVSLVRLIPGCDRLEETAPHEYRGQVQIPVAAVAGVYETLVHLQESSEPFMARFDGEMSGPAGALRGSAWFRLTAGGEPATSILAYEGQGIITGPLGGMDGRIAEGVARSLLNQGLNRLDCQLQEPEARAILEPVAERLPAAPNRAITHRVSAARHFLGCLTTRIRSLFGKHS